MAEAWMKCSACRTDIAFLAVHQVCSVSTCNRSRTRLVFCSVPCWDSHVATLRHREAWAVEARAPSQAAWAAELAASGGEGGGAPVAPRAAPAASSAAPAAPAVRRAVVSPAPSPLPGPSGTLGRPDPSASSGPALAAAEDEMLIVVSKLKKYIRERSGMNTSDAVADVLSEHVRAIADEAIRTAGRDGRKTVLDRDVPKPPRR